MIEIPATSLLPDHISYQSFAAAYLPSANYIGIVSALQQKQCLHEMDSQLRKGKFYFTTDVASGEVTNSNGVQDWLGYSDKSFSSRKLSQLLYPSHAVVQTFYAAALYTYAIEIGGQPQWDTVLFSITVALKCVSGKYWYCKRDVYPFQFDDDNKITSLLHEFILVKEYEGELFSLHVNALHQKVKERFCKQLKKLFAHYSGFSSQEYRMLFKYGTGTTNSAAISDSFGIKKSTVETYNQRILRKTDSKFPHQPYNAREAAVYFKRLRLM